MCVFAVVQVRQGHNRYVIMRGGEGEGGVVHVFIDCHAFTSDLLSLCVHMRVHVCVRVSMCISEAG